MKLKNLFCLICTLFGLQMNSQSDAAAKINTFYGCIEINSAQSVVYKNYGKYFDAQAYNLQWANFNFRSPQIGIGFFHKKKILFKSDLAFWYGVKKFSWSNTYKASTIDGYNDPFYDNYYYSVTETAYGNAAFYNLDWNTSVGLKLGKSFSILAGFRKNFLLYYSISDGGLAREGYRYKDNQGFIADERLEYYHTFYKDNQSKSKNHQTVSGVHFVTLSLLYNHDINNRNCFAELQYAFPNRHKAEANNAYINLKLGVSVFKTVSSSTKKES